MQLKRLRPALRVAGEAAAVGEVTSIRPEMADRKPLKTPDSRPEMLWPLKLWTHKIWRIGGAAASGSRSFLSAGFFGTREKGIASSIRGVAIRPESNCSPPPTYFKYQTV